MGRSRGQMRIPRTLRLLLLASLAWAWGGAAALAETGATGEDAWDGDRARVRAELLVDAEELAPGKTVRVGVAFELDPGWHIYWRNSGESGLPTELEWSFPGEVGPTRWPVPHVYEESDGFLTTYGYGDSVLLGSEAVVSRTAAGSARIAVVADFVTCNIGCIPGRIEMARTLSVGSGRPAAQDVARRFEAAEAQMPASADALGLQVEGVLSKSAVRPGDDFHVALSFACSDPEAAGCGGLHLAADKEKEAFLPENVPTLELSPQGQLPLERGGFSLVLAGHASPDDPGRFEQRLRGLVPVAFDARADPVHVEVDVPIARAFVGEAVGAVESGLWTATGGFGRPEPPMSALYALALGLLGGLILNLMPCVLPILAIKVFHVAEMAHRSRREVLAHGVAYTGGVLASMWLLAAIVIGLRAAGTAVGWGFQFQEPIFIAVIATVLVVFALNLFGVFEVTLQPHSAAQIGAESTGTQRSFFEGLLAVVLATPCTAPFLGTAVGFAFASTPATIVAMFTAIGLGLAGPYAASTLVPAWAKWIPKPGPWMMQVRRFLGFSLVGTTVWLLWVLGRTVGIDGQAAALGYLVVVAFAFWIFGALQATGRRFGTLAAGAAAAVVAVLGLLSLPLEPQRAVASAGVAEAGGVDASGIAWRPWDPGVIRQELGQGRPVFVDFTADWCITCKVNETVVLENPRVVSEFDRLGVATFKADWTLYDEGIRKVLASYGKAGVPMYLVYDPNAPADPVVLPELLTIDIVVDALRDATGKEARASAMNAPPTPGLEVPDREEERS